MLRKLIAGSPHRKTRLHDERGNRVSLARLLRNGPRAMASGLGRLTLGRRPCQPWISYDAQRMLDAHLRGGKSVLEFGSGMSTLWYAQRAARVVSIERDPGWHAAMSQQIGACDNAVCHLATTREAYLAAAPDAQFDLIMIDGSWRPECAAFAIEHLAPGGVIYLDNADMNPGPLAGNIPAARAALLQFAEEAALPVREYTDFAPTQFHVQGGLMIGGLA